MTQFETVFTALKSILAPYADRLTVTTDTDTVFSLDTAHDFRPGQKLFFGAVEIRKNYVSFHLMPVYVDPALLTDLSDGLRKRMQGKACFNFKAVDETLFSELAALTQQGFESYRNKGYV